MIKGKYWIVDGHVDFADGDISDHNQEMLATDAVVREYSDAMSFSQFLRMDEGLKIIHIDPEEDWEYGDQAYQIAKMVKIRSSSNKNPTIIALNDKDEVIGAVFTSWMDDDEMSQHAGEPVAHWDFDVVVHPQWQGYEMIGMKLIRQAEAERKNLERELGQRSYTRTWVVNPRLAKVLQTPRYGYTSDGDYEDGSAHLTKWD